MSAERFYSRLFLVSVLIDWSDGRRLMDRGPSVASRIENCKVNESVRKKRIKESVVNCSANLEVLAPVADKSTSLVEGKVLLHELKPTVRKMIEIRKRRREG